jgi:nucleotide-binding universal stress UspA family protein
VAARYADMTDAHVNVLFVAEGRERNPLLPAAVPEEVGEHAQDMLRVTLRQQFSERLKNPDRLDCQARESASLVSALKDEVRTGAYDLVVLGAENNSLVERLYLGEHIEAALTELSCPVALVIPRIGTRRG